MGSRLGRGAGCGGGRWYTPCSGARRWSQSRNIGCRCCTDQRRNWCCTRCPLLPGGAGYCVVPPPGVPCKRCRSSQTGQGVGWLSPLAVSTVPPPSSVVVSVTAGHRTVPICNGHHHQCRVLRGCPTWGGQVTAVSAIIRVRYWAVAHPRLLRLWRRPRLFRAGYRVLPPLGRSFP